MPDPTQPSHAPIEKLVNTAAPETPVSSSERERKQFTIFLAGCGFTLYSALITRRAVARRMRWARPTYFQHNNMHPEQKINGALEALEALSVATVNVFSWSITFVGGMMWATDTSNIQEIRDRLRVRLGLNEEEQKGSQAVVGEWIDAAKVWKRGKSPKEESTKEPAPEKHSPADRSNKSDS
jgi:hypothetical protein